MSETPSPSPQARWGRDRRLTFIDFRLLWTRRLNRRDLRDFFGISTPQASADIQAYMSKAPGNMAYDASQKVYMAPESFEPKFVPSSASAFLSELHSLHTGNLAEDTSFIGDPPPYDAVPIPGRNVDSGTLIALLGAIRERHAIRVLYQSMSAIEPSWRWISPHALASDGLRYHARAYCHNREDFRDFVLSRIIEVDAQEEPGVSPEDDRDWHRMVTVSFAPHPDLSEGQRRVIECEYDMEEGEKRLTVRAALAFYLLVRLNLDRESERKSPAARQIVLLNAEELEELRGPVPESSTPLPPIGVDPHL